MASQRKATQRKLMKKYNIIFDGPIDSIREPTWPGNCEAIFRHIKQLGRTEFEQYRDAVNADFLRQPWREQVQRRAKRVTERAKLCLEGRKNEAGWRLALEPEIMGRFTVEVACRKCRGRLWRSEQEVVPSQIPEEDAPNSLTARQKRRQPCTCDSHGSSDDIYEQGINPLFDDRADEAFVYNAELQAELPRREERPDRVYGLRLTNRLERLLLSAEDKLASVAGMSTDGNLKSSPFRFDGEPIVFPFLILEAKSEKGADAFTDIQVQTAFAIRELLSIQHDLGQAADEGDGWDGGPLVWFVSYKGDHWRVAAAYIGRTNGVTSYHITRLWDGSVDSLDNALQLLLIIDYIVDWARDIYREGVAQSLKKISAHDSRSLTYDTDIFSMARHIEAWATADCQTEYAGPDETHAATEDPLRAFDSPHGVIRDARFIRTRFIGLYITEENFSQLLNSTSSRKESKTLALSLLACLKKSCRLKRSLLDEYEFSWTGMDRNGSDLSAPDNVFLGVFTATSYLTSDWEQVRELSYVAIAETLVDRICTIADVKRVSPDLLSQIPSAESMPPFQSILKCIASDHISACMSRRCLQTVHSAPTGRDPHYTVQWKPLPSKDGEAEQESQREMAIAVCFQSAARELVYSLYLKHKIGRIEPTSPIFRLSTKNDLLNHPKDSERGSGPLSNFAWPGVSHSRSLDAEKFIFINSHPRPEFSDKANICLFLMDPSVLESGISEEYLTDDSRVALLLKRFEGGPTLNEASDESSRPIKDSKKIFRSNLEKFLIHLKSTEHQSSADGSGGALGESHQAKQVFRTQWEVLTRNSSTPDGTKELEVKAEVSFSQDVRDDTPDTDSSNDSWMYNNALGPECIVIDDDENERKKSGSSQTSKRSRRRSNDSNQSTSKRKASQQGRKRVLTQISENTGPESSAAAARRRRSMKES